MLPEAQKGRPARFPCLLNKALGAGLNQKGKGMIPLHPF
jgi:hypothetical protein